MNIIVCLMVAIFGLAGVQCLLTYKESKNNFHTFVLNGRTFTVDNSLFQRMTREPDRAEQILIRHLEKNNPRGTINYRQEPTQAEITESQTFTNYRKPVPRQPYDQGIGDPNGQTFDPTDPNKEGIPRPDTGFDRKIPSERDSEDVRGSSAILNFGWELFKNSNSRGNFVISPLSPQILLSYLAWVADGRTRNELKGVTGYGSPRPLERTIQSMLSSGTKKELQIATAFFTSKDMRLNKDFLEKSYHFADIVEVDFKNPSEAGRTISRWAKSKTKGGLKLNEVNYAPSTQIALTNAIYFKANWIYSFEDAVLGDFYTENGRAIRTPMLSMRRKFRWGNIGDYAQWAAIPYESSEAFVIILPNEGQNLDSVIDRMGIRELENIMNGIDVESTKAKLNITMPKFKIESTTSLIEPLKKMGVSSLFTPRAELPYLSDTDAVQVTNAEQQASMEVNEKGTVLVAFTNLNVVALSFQQPVPNVDFFVNRPFVAMVADTDRKLPLMMAKITNPSD